MKILIILLLSCYCCFPQPKPPARILIPIKNDSILKGDFNNYLVDAFVFQDSLQQEEKINSKYVTYHNLKNYYPFEIYNDSIATVYPFIANKDIIPKNAVIQLSFLEKSTMREMVIYFRLPRDFGSGMFLQLENLHFLEGNFFFDSCKSERKYRLKSRNKRNYGEGKIDLGDSTYPITELVDMSKLKRHKIKDAELNRFIKSSPCK